MLSIALFSNKSDSQTFLMVAGAIPATLFYLKNFMCAPLGNGVVLMKRLSQLCSVCVLSVVVAGCASQKSESTDRVSDQPIATYQRTLLDEAFEIASAMQLDPHIKDRSRAQEKVIQAAFSLQQPVRALEYSEEVANWRRGAAIADYAHYSVEHGITNGIPDLLKQAEAIAWRATQEWRRDSVLKRIELVNRQMVLLSDKPLASTSAEEDFEQLGALAKGELDAARGRVGVCVGLYEKYYTDAVLRQRAEDEIKASWASMPVFLRIDCLQQLVEIALAHEDWPAALKLVNEGQLIIEQNTWPIEYRIPFAAQLAALRFQAGDSDTALHALNELLKDYQEQEGEIIDIDRADALIPLAEAFEVSQQHASALDVYRMAISAAVKNPNSRPRAEDLSSICVSLALHHVEPDKALWAQLKSVKGQLGAPW